MTNESTFIPKDREGASHVIRTMLYERLKICEEIENSETFLAGLLVQMKNQKEHEFIRSLLDVIERS